MNRKKVVIWGAGNYGKRAYASLVTEFELNVIAYIDSNPVVAGGFLYGVPVVEPDYIRDLEFEQIFIAISDCVQIAQIRKNSMS